MRVHVIVDVPDWKGFGEVATVATEKLQPLLWQHLSAKVVGVVAESAEVTCRAI